MKYKDVFKVQNSKVPVLTTIPLTLCHLGAFKNFQDLAIKSRSLDDLHRVVEKQDKTKQKTPSGNFDLPAR